MPLIILIWLATLLALQPSSQVQCSKHGRQLVPSPDTDPFYQPPSGFAAQQPGTILRQRNISVAIFGLIAQPVEAYQLLYRSTAIDGSAIATVTTVFKPPMAKMDRFVSFQTAYDTAATICNPSYNYQLGTVPTDLIASIEVLVIQAYLLSGYIVASPDYEGPDAAFAAGRLEGMGVLDGMRAVSSLTSLLGLSTTRPMIVGAGYSGGAIATGWAASLHSTYAPELAIRGWTSGGIPANLTGTIRYLDGSIFSGFIPAILNGLTKSSAYKQQLGPLFKTILTTRGQSLLDFTNSNCATADQLHFPKQSVQTTTFQSLGHGFLYEPTFSSVLQHNIIGHYPNEVPIAPIFLYHALQDEQIPYTNASVLYRSWCTQGAVVQFTTFKNGGHASTEALGLPAVIRFTDEAFANTSITQCVQDTKLDSLLNPLALGAELEPISIRLIDLLAATSNDGTSTTNK